MRGAIHATRKPWVASPCGGRGEASRKPHRSFGTERSPATTQGRVANGTPLPKVRSRRSLVDASVRKTVSAPGTCRSRQVGWHAGSPGRQTWSSSVMDNRSRCGRVRRLGWNHGACRRPRRLSTLAVGGRDVRGGSIRIRDNRVVPARPGSDARRAGPRARPEELRVAADCRPVRIDGKSYEVRVDVRQRERDISTGSWTNRISLGNPHWGCGHLQFDLHLGYFRVSIVRIDVRTRGERPTVLCFRVIHHFRSPPSAPATPLPCQLSEPGANRCRTGLG